MAATKNEEQVSNVRRAKHGWILTVIFSILSLLWIAPILVVFMNSFKRKAFIFQHPLEQNRLLQDGRNLYTVYREPSAAG